MYVFMQCYKNHETERLYLCILLLIFELQETTNVVLFYYTLVIFHLEKIFTMQRYLNI